MPINEYTNAEQELFDNYSGEEKAPVSGPSSVLAKDQIVEYAPEQAPKYDFQKGPVRPKISPLESGTRGAIDAGTMNYGDELYGAASALGGKDPEEEAAYQRYMNQEAYSQNPGNYLTGSVAGSMALNAIPYVGAAANSGRLMRGAVGAGKGAVEGFGSGDDLQSRVSNALTGGVVGGLTAGLGEPIVRGSIEALTPTPTGMFDRARYRAVKAVTGSNRDAQAKDMMADYPFHGEQLLKPTEELGGKAVIQFGNKPETTAQLAEQARAGVGAKMGEAVQAIDQNIPFMLKETKTSLTQKLQDLPRKLGLPQAEGKIGSADRNEIEALSAQVANATSIEDLTKIKNRIKFDPSKEQPSLAATKQAMRDTINDGIKEATENSKDLMGKGLEPQKDLLANYLENAKKYRAYKPASELLGKQVTSERLGNNVSPAGIGTIKSATLAALNFIGLQRGNSAMAVSYNNLAKVLDAFPEPMKKFYPMLLEASKRGGTSLAVTHAALLNKNPEYKQMIEEGGGE